MTQSATTRSPIRSNTSQWVGMPYELGNLPGARASIGLITLDCDLTIEPELWVYLPKDGVALYSNRIPMAKDATVETLRDMEDKITETAQLLPTEYLDVIAFGCTSGTMAIGEATVSEHIRKAKPGICCSDPITASIKGLKVLGCQRIALLTPYIDEVNAVVENYVTNHGFDIAAKGSFKVRASEEMCMISPQAIYAAAYELGQADVDAVFISCTGLRASSVIAPLEQALGKPVVASNQALSWDCLRLAGYKDKVEGYGRLLRDC